MSPLRRFVAAACCALVALAAPGCVKLTARWTIFPDGAGKLEIDSTVRFPGFTGKEAKDSPQVLGVLYGGNPFTQLAGVAVDPEKVKVEWTNGEVVTKGVGYFQDIRQVTRNGAALVAWASAPGGGFTCTFNKAAAGGDFLGIGVPMEGAPPTPVPAVDVPEGQLPPDAEVKDEPPSEPLPGPTTDFKGLAVAVSVRLPGRLTETACVRLDDFTFQFGVTDKTLASAAALDKFEKQALAATCAAPPTAGKEAAEFRKELAAAVEAAKKAEQAPPGEEIIKEEVVPEDKIPADAPPRPPLPEKK